MCGSYEKAATPAVGASVEVTIKGTVELPTATGEDIRSSAFASEGSMGFLKIRDTESALYHYVWFDSYAGDEAVVKVTAPPAPPAPVVPANWPPTVGDVWRAKVEDTDVEYVATKVYDGLSLIPLDRTTDHQFYSTNTLSEFLALSPVKISRLV